MDDPLTQAFDAEFGGENTLLTQHQAAEPEPDPDEEPPAPAEPETPADTEPEGEPETVVEAAELLAGKYKTVQELEAGYKAIEAKLGDGDYRALKEAHDDMAAKIAAIEAAQQTPAAPTAPPSLQPDWLDEEAFTDPQVAEQTVLWAAVNQPGSYQRALRTWHEVDSYAATDFQLRMLQAQSEQTLDERIAPLQSLPEKQAANDQAAANQAAFERAWTSVLGQNPDLAEYEQAILDAAQTVPAVAAVFTGADAGQMEGTIDLLLAKARQQRQLAGEIAAEQTAEETNKAKAKGAATRATTTSQNTPKPAVDPLLEVFDRGMESLSPWTASRSK